MAKIFQYQGLTYEFRKEIGIGGMQTPHPTNKAHKQNLGAKELINENVCFTLCKADALFHLRSDLVK